MHTLVAVWLFTLWLALQNVPERFYGQNGFLQKYLSSEVLKAAVLSALVIALTFILRDNLHASSLATIVPVHEVASVSVIAQQSSPDLEALAKQKTDFENQLKELHEKLNAETTARKALADEAKKAAAVEQAKK